MKKQMNPTYRQFSNQNNLRPKRLMEYVNQNYFEYAVGGENPKLGDMIRSHILKNLKAEQTKASKYIRLPVIYENRLDALNIDFQSILIWAHAQGIDNRNGFNPFFSPGIFLKDEISKKKVSLILDEIITRKYNYRSKFNTPYEFKNTMDSFVGEAAKRQKKSMLEKNDINDASVFQTYPQICISEGIYDLLSDNFIESMYLIIFDPANVSFELTEDYKHFKLILNNVAIPKKMGINNFRILEKTLANGMAVNSMSATRYNRSSCVKNNTNNRIYIEHTPYLISIDELNYVSLVKAAEKFDVTPEQLLHATFMILRSLWSESAQPYEEMVENGDYEPLERAFLDMYGAVKKMLE